MKSETQESYQERMLRVMVYLQAHLHEDVSLETLAHVACFSPYHFHRIFRGMIGETVAAHVRRLRLERAAQQLVQADRSVTDLAFDAGYENVESFTRAFTQQFDISPSAYRKDSGTLVAKKLARKTQGESSMKVHIEELPDRKVIFIRHSGPYAECGTAWEKLCTWAGPRGLLQPGSEFIGLSHDDPDVTPAANIRYDACITTDADVEPEGEIGVQTIPGGLFAVATHHGSYMKLSDSYAEICGRWAPENAYEMRAVPCMEVYLNSPEDTPEDELLTDIHVPIEKG